METLNKNGVSITQTPGEEYDYCHFNDNLFSILGKYYRLQNDWLKTQK